MRYTRVLPRMQDKKKRGRPPGGDQPGERVVDYPQLSVRVPRATLRKLRAAATVQHLSHAKVLADAVDRYLDALQPDQKTLVEGLLRRATDVFEQPSKRPHMDRGGKANHGPERRRSRGRAVRALVDPAQGRLERGGGQTGRSALEAVRRHHPDVVLLDVNLPDINGMEVCRQIKATPRHATSKSCRSRRRCAPAR